MLLYWSCRYCESCDGNLDCCGDMLLCVGRGECRRCMRWGGWEGGWGGSWSGEGDEKEVLWLVGGVGVLWGVKIYWGDCDGLFFREMLVLRNFEGRKVCWLLKGRGVVVDKYVYRNYDDELSEGNVEVWWSLLWYR